MNNQANKPLYAGLIFSGAFAFVLSVWAGVSFYSNLAGDSGGGLFYALSGALLALVTALLAAIIHQLWSRGAVAPAGALFVLWAGLTGYAVFAEFGYFAQVQENAQRERAVQSDAYLAAQVGLEAARGRVESLSHATPQAVAAARAELARIDGEMQGILAGYAQYMHPDCTPKTDASGLAYKSRAAEGCAAVRPLLEQARAQKAIIDAGAAYAQALSGQEAAALRMADAGAEGGHLLHLAPAYVWAERMTGVDAAKLQAWTAAGMALVVELWVSLAAVLLSMLYGERRHDDPPHIGMEALPGMAFAPGGFMSHPMSWPANAWPTTPELRPEPEPEPAPAAKPAPPKKPAPPRPPKAAQADTGTEPPLDRRYQYVKALVQQGQINPTETGIRGVSFGGQVMGRDVARRYFQALKNERVIQ